MVDDALALAKAIEAARLRRRKFFDPDLFDEHAWDVLLVLFIASEEGRPIRRQELSGIVGSSEALLQRWLTLLESTGQIEQANGSTDELRLSFEAKRKMLHTLSPIHLVV